MDYEKYNHKQKEIFPKVQELNTSFNYIGLEERYQYQYPIIMKYLKNKINGWNIGDFMYSIGVQKVVLYAITEFTEMVISDLSKYNKNIEILYVCDKNYKKYGNIYHKCKVCGIDELLEKYNAKEFDKILICSIFHVNEIFEDLMMKNIRLEDMISVCDVIFSVGRESVKHNCNSL